MTVDNWQLDGVSPIHPHFDASIGVYNVPCDGLYAIKLQIIPLDGDALRINRQRDTVRYVVRLDYPCPKDEDIECQYFDVGPTSFGQVEHLARGTSISCERLPDWNDPTQVKRECLRLGVACIQRKRKYRERALTNKEKKWHRHVMYLKRKNRSVHSSEDSDLSSDDSEWYAAFESDFSQSEHANVIDSSAKPGACFEPVQECIEDEDDGRWNVETDTLDQCLLARW